MNQTISKRKFIIRKKVKKTIPSLPQEMIDLIFKIKSIQEEPFKKQMKKALDEMLSIGIPHFYPVERFINGPCLIYDKEDIEDSGLYEEHWVEQFRELYFECYKG